MFSMCTPEIFSCSFWTLFTYKLFFPTPGILPHTRSFITLYKVLYRACQYLIQSGQWLLSNATFPVLPSGASSPFFWITPNAFMGICSEQSPLPARSSCSSPLFQIPSAFKVQTNAASLRKPPLLSLPPLSTALLSEPLAWQFTDCHHT